MNQRWMRILWGASVLLIMWQMLDITKQEQLLAIFRRSRDQLLDAFEPPEREPEAGWVRAMMDEARRITKEDTRGREPGS